MKKQFLHLFLFLILTGASFSTNAQTKIGGLAGAADADALLQLGDSLTTKGLLLPRVALSATNLPAPMSAHKAGMAVYNTATAGIAPNNVIPGIYYNDGSAWLRLSADTATALVPDTLKGDNFISVVGGEDAVLHAARTTLNLDAVSDSLTNSLRFIDSLTTNTAFRDSIQSIVQIPVDTLSGDSYITITGGDGAVLQNATTNLNLNAVSDSLTSSVRFVDSLTTNTTFRDSIQSIVRIPSDTLSGDSYITITGGDGAVLQNARTNLNLNAVSDSLTSSVRFVDSLTTNTTFRDSVQSIVRIPSDTLSGDSYITITGGDGAVLQDASTSLNINAVSDSLSGSSRFVDSLVGNTAFRDSVQSIVQIPADTLTGDGFITVTGGNGALLKNATTRLNLPAVTDTLNKLNLFWSIGGNTATNPATNFIGTSDNAGVSIRANNVQGIYITPGGTVGIGTGTAPTAALDVNGAARLRTLASGAAADSIVTADANGNLRKRKAADVVGTLGWLITGNAGTDSTSNFLGTTDIKPLLFRINNTKSGMISAGGSTSLGYKTLQSMAASGYQNTAMGAGSMMTIATGGDNTAMGFNALSLSSAGVANTAIGSAAMQNMTGTACSSCSRNTAVGYLAMTAASTSTANNNGTYNTALGISAMNNSVTNISGSYNVAVGAGTLIVSAGGSYNTAVGPNAGSAVNGNNNIMIGGANSFNINPSAGNVSNEMNIGNTLFGTSVNSTVGTGKIGINTNAPSVALDINGAARVRMLASGAATDSIVTADATGNLHQRAATAVAWTLTGNTAATTRFLGTTDNSSLHIRTNNAERMVVDSTGNVGIGTTAAAATLDVQGSQAVKFNIGTTIGASDYVVIATGNITLPAANAARGRVLAIRAQLNTSVMVSAAVGDKIDDGSAAVPPATFTTPAGGSVKLMSDGVATWYVIP